MFVNDAWTFCLVRILLGVAEAGFFPGIILYLTFWFPARERAPGHRLFHDGHRPWPVVISNPLSGAIMEYLHLTAGFKGWQWLFLLEGLPSVLVGFAVLYWLTDRPDNALWLAPAERDWLVERPCAGRNRSGCTGNQADRLRAMFDRRVWLLIGLYFTVAVGSNGRRRLPADVDQESISGSKSRDGPSHRGRGLRRKPTRPRDVPMGPAHAASLSPPGPPN